MWGGEGKEERVREGEGKEGRGQEREKEGRDRVSIQIVNPKRKKMVVQEITCKPKFTKGRLN